MSDTFRNAIKKLEGDGPVEKHILLLKLSQSLESRPAFAEKPTLDVDSPERQWLAEVGALLTRLGINKAANFKAAYSTLASHWKYALTSIQGQVLDAIEELKLDLELDGRAEFGSAYPPGDTYRFFADLKAIISGASQRVLVVDPYFDGQAFDAYLSHNVLSLDVRVLVERYAKDVLQYVEKHRAQFGSKVQLASSKELHDRLLLVDSDAAWIMGGSIKDAGKKATYLIPLATPIAVAKHAIYEDVWNRSQKLA